MDLFSRKKKTVEDDVPKPMREPEPESLKPEPEMPVEPPTPDEETRKIDEDTARIQFRIWVRELNDIETQLKSGRPVEVDELRRDKIPTINRLMNKADMVKLDMKNLLDGFKNIGYDDNDIKNLKKEALSKDDYMFITV